MSCSEGNSHCSELVLLAKTDASHCSELHSYCSEQRNPANPKRKQRLVATASFTFVAARKRKPKFQKNG